MSNKKKNIKKYSDGGELTANIFRGIADTGLSALGLDNAISEKDYRGYGAKDIGKISNITGGVTKGLLPIAGGILGASIGGPIGAQLGFGLTQGIQGAAGKFNPQNDIYDDPSKRQADQAAGVLGTSSMALLPLLGQNKKNDGMNSAFAYGGQTGVPNANIEKQENTLNPNGSSSQFNAPSHSEGGQNVNLDPSTLIFSDRLKLGGKTFADLNKKNNTNKEDKMLADEKANNLEKITAQLMKEAKIKKSLALFDEQEKLKSDKLGKYANRIGMNTSTFMNGGIKKYPNGGVGPDNEEYGTDQIPGGIVTDNPTLDTNKYQDYTEPFSSNTNNMRYGEEDYSGYGNSSNSNKPNWGKIAGQVLQGVTQNAGNLYDLSRSQKADVQSFDRVTPNLVDPTSELNYNKQVFRSANEGLRNSSVGNSSTYIQNRKDLAINQMMTNARIKSQYDNQNAAILNRASEINANTQMNESNANEANLGANRNIRSTAIGSIGQNIMGQVKSNNAQKMDNKYLDIIKARYPEILNDPELKNIFNKD